MKIASSAPPVEEENKKEQDDDIASALNDLQVLNTAIMGELKIGINWHYGSSDVD